MNIKHKIWSLPIVAIMIFAVGITITYTLSSSTSTLLNRVEKVDYPFLEKTQLLVADLAAIQEALKNAVTADDKRWLDSASVKAANFRKNAESMAAIPGKGQLAGKIKHEFGEYYQSANESAAIMLGVKVGDVSHAVQKMQPALQTLNATLLAAQQHAGAQFESGLSGSQGYVQRGLMINIAMAGLIIVGLGLISYFIIASITRSITHPMQRAVQMASAIAQGDLTQHIEITSKDEIGQMMNALKGMNESLAGIVSNVRGATDLITTGAMEIAAGSSDLSQRTEEQASGLEETASTMEELTSTVKQNADNAKHANQLAANAADVAVKGGQVMNQVVDTMSSISSSSKKIVDIIGVIEGIAFQTNILALNAAVEAARAGDQGRGFAVVAAEVRNLAQRSAAAAKEIKSLIGDSVDKVNSGSKLVDQAGETMSELVLAVNRVTGIMADIAAASNEQSGGIEQVNQAIIQMDQVTQQNAALVEQAAAAAESMQEQAHVLLKVVSIFKLDVAAKVISRSGTALATPKPFTPVKVTRKLAKIKVEKDDEWQEF